MWIDGELPSLTAVLEQAGAASRKAGRYTRWLGYLMWACLDARCDWWTAHRVSQLVLDTAEAKGDQDLAACGLLLLGRSVACLGNYRAALQHLDRALEVFRGRENHMGVFLCLNALGVVDMLLGEPAASLGHLTEALELMAT